MKYYLLPERGEFYKVNMHCHTNISDGQHSPEEVKEWYKSHGYSAVCYTDHEVLIGHEELCDDKFIALHGYEVAIKKDITRPTGAFMPVYHLNMVAERQDIRKMPRYYAENPSMPGDARRWAKEQGVFDPNDTISATQYDKEWVNQFIKDVSAGGFLVTYNHPQWSLQGPADYVGLDGLHAIEAINGGCSVLNDNTSIHYEQMLRSGMRIIPNGGDDNHRVWDLGRAWTMIKAPALSYDALIAAYKNGDCYASDGPEIKALYIEDGEIVIKTSPAASVTMLCEGRYCGQKSATADGPVTEARFAYRPEAFGRYFRFEVKTADGKRAYSSAYYPEKISI